MRLFYFLILLLTPALSFGQACTRATLAVADTNGDGDGNPNTYSCTTLTISTALNRTPDGSASPIIVTVSGNVVISANISVNGGDGFTITADGVAGPNGGPGAVSAGGGVSGTEGQPSFSGNVEDGIAPPRNGGCNEGGGGGGGFSAAGDPGKDCANVDSVSGTGGADWGSVFPLTRGGFGGAAGGAYDNGAYSVGSGGGGGGAIHIISTGGTITINSGVTIAARGGRGGNSTNIGGGGFGGGGGGGSGGVILLDGALGVTLNGILDVRGGARGTSPGGGHGGAGKSGVYRVVANGSTVLEGTEVTTPTVTSSPITKFKSDISCGTIAKKNENQQMMFQMMVGFAMIALLKILFRFRVKVS